MNTYKIKLKHIFPTFLAVVLGTTILYLFFRWLFTIQTQLLVINEQLLDIWLPLVISFIPITIWLRPKLRILKLKDGDNRFLYQLVVWVMTIVMMMTSNSYLKTATGKLTSIQNIESLLPPYSRYVSIKDIALDQQRISSYIDIRVDGGDDPDLNFDAYVVFPFKTLNAQNKELYWYGLHFDDHISASASKEAKEQRYKEFVEKTNKEIEKYQFSQHHYYSILQHSHDHKNFAKAIQKLKITTPTNQLVIITPEKGLYADRSGTSLPWTFGSFALGTLIFLITIALAGYDAKEHKRQLKGVKAESDDLVEILSLLIPRDDHFVGSILVNLSLLVFFVMVFSGEHVTSPSASELLSWGANHRPSVLKGEWWRLITSMFVHGGIMHLLMNIYGFVIAAIFIESRFTRFNYFLLYLLSGIGGGLASIFWHENTVSVGASGAIFGLYGALLALSLTKAFKKDEKKQVWIFIGPYVGLNLVLGIVGNIDNAAHIGGLLSGAFFGILIYKFGEKKIYKVTLSKLAHINANFQFKGHPDVQTMPKNISKLVVSLNDEKESMVFNEYYYEAGKLIKHIDHIEHSLLQYHYNEEGNLTEERQLGFDKSPDKSSLEGYAKLEYKENKLIKETLYWILDKKECLQYENSKNYVGDLLMQDNYRSPKETYTVQQSYDEAGNLIKVVFGENERIHTLKYNDEGYVIERIIFKPKQDYSKQVFSYQQGRLHKTNEYFYLALDTMYDAKEEDIKATLEQEYWYDAQGLLIKQTITDLLENKILNKLVYQYEYLPNP